MVISHSLDCINGYPFPHPHPNPIPHTPLFDTEESGVVKVVRTKKLMMQDKKNFGILVIRRQCWH